MLQRIRWLSALAVWSVLASSPVEAADVLIDGTTRTTTVTLGSTDKLTVTTTGTIRMPSSGSTNINSVVVGAGVDSITNNGLIVATRGLGTGGPYSWGIQLADNSSIANGIVNTGTITGYLAAIGVTDRNAISNAIIDGGIRNSGRLEITYTNQSIEGEDPSVVMLSGVTLTGGIDNSGSIIFTGTNSTRVSSLWLTNGTIVGGGIVNSGTISSRGNAPITLATDTTINGGITNTATGLIESVSAGHGIRLNLNSTVNGGINNQGVVRGTGASGDGIFVNTTANILTGGITNSGTIVGARNALNLTNAANAFTVSNSGLLTGTNALGINTLNLEGASARVTGPTAGAGATVNVNGSFSSENTFNVRTFNVTAGGTFVMNNGVTTGAGNFNNAGILQVDAGKTVTLSGTLVSSGTSLITGGLTVGRTSVTGGRFTVNNTLTSNVAVSGGTLGGSGSIVGALAAESGGTLAPGNSIDSLAAGATSFSSGATFAYEVDSSAALGVAADLLVVSGSLTIASGSLLTLTDIAGTKAPFVEGTSVFAMINYTGAWNGGLFTYKGTPLANGSRFLFGGQQWKIDYDYAYNPTNPTTLRPLNYQGDFLPTSGTQTFVAITAVPEPATCIMALAGLAFGVSFVRRRHSDVVRSDFQAQPGVRS